MSGCARFRLLPGGKTLKYIHMRVLWGKSLDTQTSLILLRFCAVLCQLTLVSKQGAWCRARHDSGRKFWQRRTAWKCRHHI